MDEKDNKIVLNKKTDLLKLSISQIMNTKLYNFKGPYYNQLYEEALKIGQKKTESIKKSNNNIDFIQFEVKFVSQFGQKLIITGSEEVFGNWNPNLGLSLVWNEGNLWRSSIKPYESFEYKLVLVQKDGVKCWEGGNNRKFELKKIKEFLLKLPNVSEKTTFTYEGVCYCYNKNSNTLDIFIDGLLNK